MSDRLLPNSELPKNQPLSSADGRYRLVMQDDGNLVLYEGGNHAVWATNTSGQAVSRCIMQSDGNLVIYGFNGHVVWASNTFHSPGASLVLQNDRNLVIYEPNHAVWASNTNL
jgi:hypothetical protein